MATSSQCPLPRLMTMDRRWRANIDPAPNCPRCASPNTKFCYYNNYSLSQPRFFCKGCRRYWTKGGSLRNIPVGGGCRKSRRSRSHRTSSNAVSGPCFSNNPLRNSPSGSTQDIDMAAVFAKFLSNNQINTENESTNIPSETSHESFDEFQVIEGLILNPSSDKQIEEEEGISQELISTDLGPFNDVLDDVFWSDPSDLSSLTWQPVSDQFQEWDSSSLPVDQSKISTNLFSDSWSCFDTTGFEAFSGH